MNWAASSITWYPTQSYYLEAELSIFCHIPFKLSAKLGSDKYFCVSLVSLSHVFTKKNGGKKYPMTCHTGSQPALVLLVSLIQPYHTQWLAGTEPEKYVPQNPSEGYNYWQYYDCKPTGLANTFTKNLSNQPPSQIPYIDHFTLVPKWSPIHIL